MRIQATSHIRYECSKAFYGALYLNKLLGNLTSIPKDFSKKYFNSHEKKVKQIWQILFRISFEYVTKGWSSGRHLKPVVGTHRMILSWD